MPHSRPDPASGRSGRSAPGIRAHTTERRARPSAPGSRRRAREITTCPSPCVRHHPVNIQNPSKILYEANPQFNVRVAAHLDFARLLQRLHFWSKFVEGWAASVGTRVIRLRPIAFDDIVMQRILVALRNFVCITRGIENCELRGRQHQRRMWTGVPRRRSQFSAAALTGI